MNLLKKIWDILLLKRRHSKPEDVQVLSITNSDNIEKPKESDYVYPTDENLPKYEFEFKPPTEQETIDQLLFQISSHFSCGRHEQGFEIVRKYLTDSPDKRKMFLNQYFDKGYYFDSSQFDLSLELLSFLPIRGQLYYVNMIVNVAPLNYSAEQIRQILEKYKREIFLKSESTLLLCLLSQRFDLLEVLIEYGFQTTTLICKDVYYNYTSKTAQNEDEDRFMNMTVFECPESYKGRTLQFVLKYLGYIK